MTGRGGSIAAAVRDRARTAGAHPAISHEGHTISYRELAAAAGRFAAVVAELPGGAPVAVPAYRTPATVAAILGVLLAGRAYLPLNPADPVARQRTVLSAAGSTHVVGGEPGAFGDLTRLEPPQLDQPDSPQWTEREAGELACVFFTSGSTGVPKGVPIAHRNASAFVDWASAEFDLGPADRIGVYAPLFFDLSTFDLFVGLRAGATLVLVGDDEAKFAKASAERLRAERITVLYTVPSALLELVAAAGAPPVFDDLRLLLLAGETFPAPQLDTVRAAAPRARLHNLYGPIESNVVAHFPVPADWPPGEPVPVGTPVSGATLALLDGHGALVDGPGTGELLISGPSLFDGYLATAAPPPDPFLTVAGRRWYRTADLAGRDADGVYRFHGRTDSRIKNRGFLVELAEVEHALGACPGLASAAVVAVESTMHAFVVPADGTGITVRVLRRWLAGQLPRYMWPAEYHVVAALPLGRTGKVDRSRLAACIGAER